MTPSPCSPSFRPKYRPQQQPRLSQDTLINFQLTQENMLGTYTRALLNEQLVEKKVREQRHSRFSLTGDDDLVYSDNQEVGEEQEERQGMVDGVVCKDSNQVNGSDSYKQTRVLSDCINTHHQSHPTNQQKKPSQLRIKSSRVKTNSNEPTSKVLSKLQLSSLSNKSALLQNKASSSNIISQNKSVFFTNLTNRSNMNQMRNQSLLSTKTVHFRVKPKASLRQIVQNAYKTERVRNVD